MPGAGEPGPAHPEFGIGEKDFVLSWACGVDGRLERGDVLPHRERFAFDECEGLFEEQSVDGFVDPLAALYRAERRVVTPHPVQGAVGVGELVTAEAGERAGQLPELVADAESEGDAELVVVHQPVVRGAGDGSLSEQGVGDCRVGRGVGRGRFAEAAMPAWCGEWDLAARLGLGESQFLDGEMDGTHGFLVSLVRAGWVRAGAVVEGAADSPAAFLRPRVGRCRRA